MFTALAIDDYAPARYAHSRVLKRAGFEVFEAADGQTGLALAQAHLPNVVLLDLNLPDIDGFEVCQRLKSSRLTRHIPVIHITATSRGEQFRTQSARAGAELFIEEPVEPDVLMSAVTGVIRTRSTAAASQCDVLLVSPYEDECDMYAFALEHEGFRVTCGSPERAADLVRGVVPRIVVTRITPGEAGLNLARSLKGDPATAHIPVVIITTCTDALHRSAAEAIGVDGYFLLPLGPDALKDAIVRLLTRRSH